MKKILQFGNALFATLMVFWLYFTIQFAYQYLAFDFSNLKSDQAKILTILFVLLVIYFLIKKQINKLFHWLIENITRYKWLVFVCLVSFQLVVTLSSLGLASGDTTIVYNIATDIKYAMSTDYISINPNNFLLLVWMKLNYLLFGQNTQFVLALWNIFFIDVTIWLSFRLVSKRLGDDVGKIAFVLAAIILGLSPQYIYLYSDPITMFLLSILLWLVEKMIVTSKKWQYALSVGVVLAITYGFRPTVMIFAIAAVICLVAFLRKFSKEQVKQTIQVFIVIVLSFLAVNRSISYSLNHQNFVKYEAGYTRTLAYYVDLGLTYSGNIHSEIPENVAQARNDERNKTAISDIHSRLSTYDFARFTGHMYYKYYWMIGEGMFGWFQERVLNENNKTTVPWVSDIQKTKFASWIRTYVYVEGENYNLYGLIIQLVWIVMAFGLLMSYKSFNVNNWYQLWMQITLFGGLLFLFIFEAGRSRYLMQFIPAIITMSSIGLSQMNSGKVNKMEE